MSYRQAYKDHKTLWRIAPAEDMTGGYVDQEDLDRLLKSPTKKTAEQCLTNQICYWFERGPDRHNYKGSFSECADQYPEILKIQERYQADVLCW